MTIQEIMEQDDKEFNDRLLIIESLKKDLQQIANKYNLEITENDQYDSEDNFSHTNHYFVVNGETWYEKIQDIILESFISMH